MKAFCLLLVVASAVAAQDDAERSNIEKTVRMLNTENPAPALFNADLPREELAILGLRLGVLLIGETKVVISKEPWGEAQWGPDAAMLDRIRTSDTIALLQGKPLAVVLPPQVSMRSVRLVTTDVALVEADVDKNDDASPVSVLLVMKRNEGVWQVASVRRLS